MRKLTLILITLLACTGLALTATAQPTEPAETASAAEVLSIFAADSAQLEVMLVLQGEPTTPIRANASSCVEDCAFAELQCLVGCGFTPSCQLYCSDMFDRCAADC